MQENSAHSLDKGKCNKKHLETDVGGKYVLISRTFYYFGNNAVLIPENLWAICSEGRNMKGPSIPLEVGNDFIEWVQNNFALGIHGDPINWGTSFD